MSVERAGSSEIAVEVCVRGVESALEAEAGGAARVELCDDLDSGGTTPSRGAIEVVRERLSIGLVVLIRPRPGDFVYSNLEFEVMLRDIESCRRLGCDGVAVGALSSGGQVDEDRTRELIARARPMAVTFHRAFDRCVDPLAALEALIRCGVDRVLSSGLEPAAAAGLPLLADLVRVASGRIGILPGAGVDVGNCREIVVRSGAREIHVGSSVQEPCPAATERLARFGLGPGGGMDAERVNRTSASRVRDIVDVLRGL